VIPGLLAACVAVLAGIGAWTLVHPPTPAVVNRIVLLPAPDASAAVRPPRPLHPPHRRADPVTPAAQPVAADVVLVSTSAPAKQAPKRPNTAVRHVKPTPPVKPHGQQKPPPGQGHTPPKPAKPSKPPKPAKPQKPHGPKPPKPPKPPKHHDPPRQPKHHDPHKPTHGPKPPKLPKPPKPHGSALL